MKKSLLALASLSAIATPISLSARELMCEQCEPVPECYCPRQYFVERSQIFLHSEFLYWTVNEGTLDYSIKSKKGPALSTFGIGKYHIADYDWRPGARAALTYYYCAHYWEATAQYTWFYTKGSNHVTKPEGRDRFLEPTRNILLAPPYEKAHSLIDFHYHVGDLYAARVFDPNPHLRMRLYGGPTMAFIEQSWKIRYKNLMSDSEKIKERWRFFGGGLRLGVTVDWFWLYQFYFTGRTSFATLIGSYHNREIQTEFIGSAKDVIGNVKYQSNRFAMNAQFLLGPSWQIPCDCWSFELFAGYEFNLWLNLHERIRTEPGLAGDPKPTSYADAVLGVHGLTLRLTLGF